MLTSFNCYTLSLLAHTNTLSLSLSLSPQTNTLSLCTNTHSISTHTHTLSFSLSLCTHKHTHSLSLSLHTHTHTHTRHTSKKSSIFHKNTLDQHIKLDSHLHHHSASQQHNIKDRRTNKGRRKENTGTKYAWRLLYNYIYLSLYCKVRKGCSRFACERVLETEHKLHILTPLLWPSRCVFLVLLILGSTPLGLSEGLPYHIWSLLSGIPLTTPFAPWTQLNYIIIQHPHDHQLDLWNRMFNRHQAEITVMQFRGYSLPVHHC